MNKQNTCTSASSNDLSDASKDTSLEELSVWRDKMVGGNVDDVAVETTPTDGIYHGTAKNVSTMLMNMIPRSVMLLKMKRKRQENSGEEVDVKKRPRLRDSGNQATRTKCWFEKAVAVLQSTTTTISNHAIVPTSQASGISQKDQHEIKEQKKSSIASADEDNLKDSSAFPPPPPPPPPPDDDAPLAERLVHDDNKNVPSYGDHLPAYSDALFHSCTNDDEAIETLTNSQAKEPSDPIAPLHAKDSCPPGKSAGSSPPADRRQFAYQNEPSLSSMLRPPPSTAAHCNDPNGCFPPNLNHGISPRFLIPQYNPNGFGCPPAGVYPSPGYFPPPPNGYFRPGAPPLVNNGQHQSSPGQFPTLLPSGHAGNPPWLGGNMAMSNGHVYAKVFHISKTAPHWIQLLATQGRLLVELSSDSSRGQPLSENLKTAATVEDVSSFSKEAHAVGDSGSDVPPGKVPKIPVRQQGDEANRQEIFVDVAEHEDELHPAKKVVPPADQVDGASDTTTRRADDPKPTQDTIPQDQPAESQDYVFVADSMESDEAEPHPVMERQKPQEDRESIIAGATRTEEDRRPAEFQTPQQDDKIVAPTNTTPEDDRNHRQEAAVEALQGRGASEESPQTILREAIATEKAYALEKHASPESSPPICEEEVATLEPLQKRVRLSKPSVQPEKHDVLCCSRSEKQYGNYVFHKMVEMVAVNYQRCTDDMQKVGVSNDIIGAIIEENGRFLNKTSDNEWYVVNQTGAINYTLQALLHRQCDRLDELERQSRHHGPTLQDSRGGNKDTPIELLDDGDDSSGGMEEGFEEPNEGSQNSVEESNSRLPNAAGADNSSAISQESQINNGWSTLGIRLPPHSPLSKLDARTARAAADQATQHPLSSMPEEQPARRQVERGRRDEPSRGLDSTKLWKAVPREDALSVLQRNPEFPFHGIITPRPLGMNTTAVWLNIVEVDQWLQRNKYNGRYKGRYLAMK
jgi:hypothetical protein